MLRAADVAIPAGGTLETLPRVGITIRVAHRAIVVTVPLTRFWETTHSECPNPFAAASTHSATWCDPNWAQKAWICTFALARSSS